jgi:hypothetical protein
LGRGHAQNGTRVGRALDRQTSKDISEEYVKKSPAGGEAKVVFEQDIKSDKENRIMIDNRISSTKPAAIQEPEQQSDVRSLVEKIRARQAKEIPTEATPSALAEPVYPASQQRSSPNSVKAGPRVSRLAGASQQPQSERDTDELTAEIIQLNRQICDEFNAIEDDNTYTIVENFALNNPKVGVYEIAVYVLLAQRCHMPKKTCKASIVSLANRLHCKRDTISKAIDKLVEVGLVERGQRDAGGAYIYILPHRHRSKPKKSKTA